MNKKAAVNKAYHILHMNSDSLYIITIRLRLAGAILIRKFGSKENHPQNTVALESLT